ncbi:MAG: hypothetical protein ABJP45_14780 [Cyclobacteriaceae bacterium]
MNQTQASQIEMYEATNEYLDRHSNLWSSIPIIGNYKNYLSIIISNIRQITSIPKEEPRMNGELRTLKMQLADKMDMLDDVMETYALDIDDKKLFEQSANTHSDYIKLPSDKFELKVRQVIALLERHVAEMADYGINSEQIEDAKLCFNTYQRKVGKPLSYTIDSRIVAQDLDGLFIEANIYLAKLDNVMLRFRRANTQFFLGFQATRQIVPL